MEQNRRQTDARMNSMETDIRELRQGQKEMQEDITLIREKIFNGFSHAIEESHANSLEIRKAVTELNSAVREMHTIVYRTPDEILANCPFKKEVVSALKKKVNWWLIVGVFILIVTNNLELLWNLVKRMLEVI